MRNIATLNVSPLEAIKMWMAVTVPFHNLTEKEQEAVSTIVYHYKMIRKNVLDESMAWKMTFDYETKIKIKNDMGIVKDYNLQNLFSRLRTKNVIQDNRIPSRFIPNLDIDSDKYEIIFRFNVKQETEENIT